MTNLDSILNSRDITLLTKVHIVKAVAFLVVMYVWIWKLDSWALKNWCFWTVVLEKTLESPLDCKDVKPVHPQGNQFWIFIGRTEAEAEAPVLWSPDVKNWLIGKAPDAGKDGRWEEKGTTEDEMVGWHHRLNGHGFGWTPGVSKGQKVWRAAVHGFAKSWTWNQLSVTELKWTEWAAFTPGQWVSHQLLSKKELTPEGVLTRQTD